MTTRTLPPLSAAGLIAAVGALPDCATSTSPRTSETAGEFVDSSVITTRVKAAFLS